MEKKGTFRMEAVRCFGSFHLWRCIGFIIIACCLYLVDSWRWVVRNDYEIYSVISIVDTMINFDRFKSLILLAAAFVYSGSFCDDWKDNYCYLIYTRTTLKKYAFTKTIINGIAVFFAVSMGILIFAGILSIFIPIYIWEDGISLGGSIDTIKYLISMILPFTLGNVFLTTLGIFFSSFVPDKLIVYTIPFLGNYLFSALTYNMSEDGMFFLGLMSSHIMNSPGSQTYSVLRKSLIFLCFTLVTSIGFYIQLKRRVENENYE